MRISIREKNSLQINKLEHVLIQKVEQLFGNMLSLRGSTRSDTNGLSHRNRMRAAILHLREFGWLDVVGLRARIGEESPASGRQLRALGFHAGGDLRFIRNIGAAQTHRVIHAGLGLTLAELLCVGT